MTLRRLAAATCAALTVACPTAPSAAGPQRGDVVFEAAIPDLQAQMAQGRLTSQDLVRAYQARIAAYDHAGPGLNAVVTLNPRALDEAAALDAERNAKGPRGPLHGIPVLLKDNYGTADMPTSAGALALATFRPREDATQVARLRKAGAVILGKTTMHELASGVTTVSSLTGYSRNPYDPQRSPGGSSGGSGAAVAASFAAAALGSDTCGSIRIPAAYQNLYGLRATRGVSSRAGIVPLSDTQDIGGPLARSVVDLALMMDATVGADPKDPVTTDPAVVRPASYAAALGASDLRGARIGVLRDAVSPATEDQEGVEVFDRVLARLKAEGAEVVDVRLPGVADLIKGSTVIPFELREDIDRYLAAHPEAPVRSLADLLGQGLHHQELDQGLRRGLNAGRGSEGHRAALRIQATIRQMLLQTLAEQKLTALAYPTSTRRPPVVRADDSGAITNCRYSAATGLPAIAVPAGFGRTGLPFGFEFLGAAYSEPSLLRLAHGWERAVQPRRAPFSTPALVDGRGPAAQDYVAVARSAGATLTATFRHDPGQGALDVVLGPLALPPGEVIGLALHRSDEKGAAGPVIANLMLPGGAIGEQRVVLQEGDRQALAAGRLRVRLYTTATPLGGPPAPLSLGR
jgi:amidase